MTRAAIEAVNLNKWLGEGETRIHFVRDACFEFRFGELIYFVGAAGSGKTAMLDLISGIQRPDSGTVKIDGTDIWNLSDSARAEFRARRIGFVFEDGHLRRASEPFSPSPLILRSRDWGSADFEAERDRNTLDTAGPPDILLLDEPAAALDELTARTVMASLRQTLLNEDRCIVIATRDSSNIEFADCVLYMEDGRIAHVQRNGLLNRRE